jgi:hypothetical protein
MFKVGSKETAQKIARDLALYHGWSIFGGHYYVGTESELLKVGVLDPVSWR